MIRIASAGLALVAGLVVSTSSASAQVPATDGPAARAVVVVVFYATPTDLTAQYGGPNRPILWGEDGTSE